MTVILFIIRRKKKKFWWHINDGWLFIVKQFFTTDIKHVFKLHLVICIVELMEFVHSIKQGAAYTFYSKPFWKRWYNSNSKGCFSDIIIKGIGFKDRFKYLTRVSTTLTANNICT